MDSTTTPKKVLIVEDEWPFTKLLSDQLIKRGYSISTAANGREGLSEAKRENPDLILLDILMPVMDGMTMFEKLRKIEKFKETPVIILTNLDPDVERRQAVMHDKNVSYCIKSNTRLEELYSKVDNILTK